MAEAAAVQGEAALAAALAAAEREATYEAMHGPGAVARLRGRARAVWGRVRIAVSELSWRGFKGVFREERRAVVKGPVLAVELMVLCYGWRGRDGARKRGQGLGKGRGNKGAGCSRVGSKAAGEDAKEAVAGGSSSSRGGCRLQGS